MLPSTLCFLFISFRITSFNFYGQRKKEPIQYTVICETTRDKKNKKSHSNYVRHNNSYDLVSDPTIYPIWFGVDRVGTYPYLLVYDLTLRYSGSC